MIWCLMLLDSSGLWGFYETEYLYSHWGADFRVFTHLRHERRLAFVYDIPWRRQKGLLPPRFGDERHTAFFLGGRRFDTDEQGVQRWLGSDYAR